MGATQRQDTIVRGDDRPIRIYANRHPTWENFLLRIYYSIRGNDGDRNHPRVREEVSNVAQITVDVPDEAKGVIFFTSEFKKWVYDHAAEVVFLMVLFGITWVIQIVGIIVSLTK